MTAANVGGWELGTLLAVEGKERLRERRKHDEKEWGSMEGGVMPEPDQRPSSAAQGHDHRWVWFSATAKTFPRGIVRRWSCRCGALWIEGRNV